MPRKVSNEASKPNPALSSFGVLVGNWTTIGSHGLLPGKILHGRTSFEWIEEGAFLMMRSEIDEPEIPSAIAILGSDDAEHKCIMLYFDERGVSRKLDVSLDGATLKWWRDAKGFSQRFVCTIADDGRTIVGKGELSRDDVTWEKDLDLTYTKAD